MKKIFQYTVVMLCSLSSIAQDVKITKSEEYLTPKGCDKVGTYDLINKGLLDIYVIYEERKPAYYMIYKFNHEMQKVAEKKLEIDPKFRNKTQGDYFYQCKDRLFFFANENNKDKEIEDLSIIELNAEDLSFMGTPKKLYLSQGRIKWGGRNSLILSEDKSKLLFRYKVFPKSRDKQDVENIGMIVLDQNMEKLWGREVQMPYPEEKMDIIDYLVKNDGKVCILNKVFNGKDKKDGRNENKPNFRNELLTYDGSSHELPVISIDPGSIFPYTTSINETHQGKILYNGFYTKTEGGVVDGCFVVSCSGPATSLKIESDGGVFEMPEKLIAEKATPKELKRMNRLREKNENIGIDMSLFNDCHITEDGSVYFVTEKFDADIETFKDLRYGISPVTTTNRVSDKTYYYGFFGDLFIMRVSPDLKFTPYKILKRQESIANGGNGLSFVPMVHGNQFRLFYFDKSDNQSLQPNAEPFIYKEWESQALVCSSIDQEGMLTSKYFNETNQYTEEMFLVYFKPGLNGELIYSTGFREKHRAIRLQVK